MTRLQEVTVGELEVARLLGVADATAGEREVARLLGVDEEEAEEAEIVKPRRSKYYDYPLYDLKSWTVDTFGVQAFSWVKLDGKGRVISGVWNVDGMRRKYAKFFSMVAYAFYSPKKGYLVDGIKTHYQRQPSN